MIVRIRKEKDQYWVYFLETRRLIGVNEVGAHIISRYFNEGVDEAVIASGLVQTYDISPQQSIEDVTSFLKHVADELRPEVFNNTEQFGMDVPLGVELEITTACNLRCRHCLQSDYSSVFMSIEKARWIINQLSKAGVFEVSIIGGEPFSHPQIEDIISAADGAGFAIGLTSNGLLITKKHIDLMAGMENISMAISIDGVGKDHDYIRGKGVFVKADKVIRSLIDNGVEVEVMFTVNSYNISKYVETLDYCRGLGIVCNFNLFKPFKDSHRSLVPDPNQFFALMRDLYEIRKKQQYKIGLSHAAIVSYLMGLEPRDECRAGQSGLVIDVHGRMLTCPSLLYCGYYKETDFPAFDENFVETWKRHPLFTQFKQNGLSGCQARSLIFSHDVKKGDPYDLAEFKKFMGQ